MIKVQFRLSMPSSPSWNGKWSGEGKNYSVVRELDDAAVRALLWIEEDHELAIERTWFHRWSDGWCAGVMARIVPAGEELPPSLGFHGYDWMIDNLLHHGTPYSEETTS